MKTINKRSYYIKLLKTVMMLITGFIYADAVTSAVANHQWFILGIQTIIFLGFFLAIYKLIR